MKPKVARLNSQSAICNLQSKASASRKPRIVVVVAAGGTGTRMKSSVPKQFLELSGTPILLYAVESLLGLKNVIQVVGGLPAGQIARARALIRRENWTVPVKCVRG